MAKKPYKIKRYSGDIYRRKSLWVRLLAVMGMLAVLLALVWFGWISYTPVYNWVMAHTQNQRESEDPQPGAQSPQTPARRPSRLQKFAQNPQSDAKSSVREEQFAGFYVPDITGLTRCSRLCAKPRERRDGGCEKTPPHSAV